MAARSGAGLRSAEVRRTNLRTLLRVLHLEGPTTRSALVRRTGLSRSSIGDLVGALGELELVEEREPVADGTPGRPSPLVAPRGATQVVLGVEIMVDSIAVGAVGLGGTPLEVVRRPRPRERSAPSRSVAAVAEMAAGIRAALDPAHHLWAVGVAVPGLVRTADQVTVVAPNLDEWIDVAVADLLTEAMGLRVPVVVDNDANLGAIAESRRGAGRDAGSLLYLSGEVGVGGGIVMDGRLLVGGEGFAGEIGHVPLNLGGLRCSCGARGCLETEVGEHGLLRRTGRDPDGGTAAVEEVLTAAARGDRAVLAALQEHGRWLGLGLVGPLNLLNPDLVVLGGLLHDLHPWVVWAAGTAIAEYRMGRGRAATPIVPSTTGVDAPLLGAAERAWDAVLAGADLVDGVR